MLDEKTIEKMFWNHCYGSNEYVLSKELELFCFKAAINLLLPIIQKQDEAIRFYADTSNWAQSHRSAFTQLLSSKDCDDADGEMIGGKLARSTQKEVSEMIKRLGGEG